MDVEKQMRKHNHIICTLAKVLRHAAESSDPANAKARGYYDGIVTSPTALWYGSIFKNDIELAWIAARALNTYVPEPGLDQLWCDVLVDLLIEALPEYSPPDSFVSCSDDSDN